VDEGGDCVYNGGGCYEGRVAEFDSADEIDDHAALENQEYEEVVEGLRDEAHPTTI
jgi:hypothetical protein